MHSVIVKLTSPSVLRMLGICGCIGWLVGGLAFCATTRQLVLDEEVLLGRDFMAFYLGGRIVAEGHGTELYDGGRQQATQDAILAPESIDGLVYYINPAPVAVAYSLLAWLPYRWALHLHTLGMLAAYFAAFWILRRHLRALGPHCGLAALVGLLWIPMAQTITGGQNAALTLLLLVAAYSATVRDRQALAGLALGLLLYKPQYALPFIGLLGLRRCWVTVAVACGVGVLMYASGGLCCGWDWPVQMAGSLGGLYHQQERVVSGYSHIALTEVVDFTVVLPMEVAGRTALAVTATWLARAAVALIVALLMWRWRDADTRSARFGLYWAVVAAAMLLISPHTQYYEVALLLLPLLLVLDHVLASGGTLTDGQRWSLLAAFCLFPFFSVAQAIQFQPLILIPIWICLWAASLIRIPDCT